MYTQLTRRQVLISGIALATTLAPTSSFAAQTSQAGSELDTRLRKELINSSRYASVGGQWTEFEFNDFIDSMGEDSLKRTCKVLNIEPSAVRNYSSNPIMKAEIRKTIANAAGGILGKDPDKIRYHEKVLIPIAQRLELDKANILKFDSLNLERAIYNKVFEQSWTSLTEDERIRYLTTTNWGIKRDKLIGLASLTGAAILADLYAAVNIIGFPFYIGMSKAIFALASSMSVTLPFSVYMSASTTLAVAASPIGWAAAAILAGTGIYAWITARKKTKEAEILKAVLHFHHYKVSAMKEAGLKLPLNGL